MKKIKVIREKNPSIFEEKIEGLILHGYKIRNTEIIKESSNSNPPFEITCYVAILEGEEI